jgi:hypothetical protein
MNNRHVDARWFEWDQRDPWKANVRFDHTEKSRSVARACSRVSAFGCFGDRSDADRSPNRSTCRFHSRQLAQKHAVAHCRAIFRAADRLVVRAEPHDEAKPNGSRRKDDSADRERPAFRGQLGRCLRTRLRWFSANCVDGNRTRDRQIDCLVLYPLSYRSTLPVQNPA